MNCDPIVDAAIRARVKDAFSVEPHGDRYHVKNAHGHLTVVPAEVAHSWAAEDVAKAARAKPVVEPKPAPAPVAAPKPAPTPAPVSAPEPKQDAK